MAPPAEQERRPRAKLGQLLTLNQRSYVFATPEAIEIDHVDGYEVTRRRVFYSDILAITHHRQRGLALIVLMSCVLASWAPVQVMVALHASWTTFTVVFMLCVAPCVAVLMLKILHREHHVTVFGRRTKAVMRWSLGGARALEVYAELVARARAQQDGDRERIAARAGSANPFAPPPSG